ncbi:MAG: transcriptional repressor, LexA family [Verrucomicrobiales bacterium]|nr:transcriptional repressor, LexA family [Verrucomicrobiales bacterium]
MEQLTDLQRRVLDFIREMVATGPPPTAREVAAQFGWSSKRAAECHIEALIRKGWITSEPGKARSLRLVEARKPLPQPPVAEIRLLGSIPAGFGQDREEDSEGCIPVTVDSLGFKPTRNTFALRVVGDSMIGKHICDGDVAVFEHGPDPRSGQIVAALIDRKNTLKTFILKNGKPFLKAENPKYPDLIPSEELVIQGVFRSLIRRAKE